MIIPMEIKHAEEVAELHYLYIRSLLRDLGKRMCIIFYNTALKSYNNFGFVFIESSKVLGFSFATEDNSQLFRNLRIRLEICFALLKKPMLIKRFLFHLRSKFPPAPESLYLATDLKIRGRGIGKRLQIARDYEFKKRGIKYYELRIDAKNIVNLYLNQKVHGAKIKEEFIENGIRRFLLYRNLDNE